MLARVNLPNMRSPGDRRVDEYAGAMRGLLDLEADPDRRAKYVDFIDIYAGLTDNERRRYRERYPEESNVMRGVVQRARDEGIEQGRVEGERTVLERQLRRRFGPLSPAAADRLHEASATDLEAWAENLLDARTLDDVFAPNP